MTIGAVILAVIAAFVNELPEFNLDLAALLLVLGVVNTAIAFFIWHRAMQTLRALHAGVIASTQLVFVPLLATWWLDEAFGLRRAVGSAIVLVGIAIVHYTRAAANRPRTMSGTRT
jgi:drug/metabolite transporter (DMT)-like permease